MRFNKMTEAQKAKAQRDADAANFSDYAIWFLALRKVNLSINNKPYPKFIVWEKGYKDASRILDGKTPVCYEAK